jgi:2-methylcitrate dehydratase PrpD
LGTRSQLDRLADFVVGFDYEDMPGQVARQAKLVLLDTLGAMLAASSPDYSAVRAITEFVEASGGTPESTVVGMGCKTSCVNAALANGTLAYYADIEPTHIGSIVHAAAVVVPSSLAVAEREGLTGKHFLTALVLGVDVACRVSYALDPRALYRRGFHPSAVAGCFGATAAASSLLGLNAAQLKNAFGLTSTQASGLLTWTDDLTENSRPFNTGIAARNGVTSALLARAGFGGPPDAFEAKYDLFTAFSGTSHPDELTAKLGQRFMIKEMIFKLYACCGLLHPALDGLLRIASVHLLDIADVEAITLRMAESAAPIIDGNRLKSHCAQYILPLALLQRRVAIADVLLERQLHPRVDTLSRRVSVVGDPELEKTFPKRRRSIVEVVTKGGRNHIEQVEFPKGYPENPLTEGELQDKFFDLTVPAVGRRRAAKINALVADIERSASVQGLTSLL